MVDDRSVSATWWDDRRDARLTELAALLAFYGADPLDDPGTGELAHTAVALAGEYQASDRGHAVHRAGDLLREAAIALHAADRLRGTAVAVVNHHLRCAAFALEQARGLFLEEAGRRSLSGQAPAAGGRPTKGPGPSATREGRFGVG
ncbi:hypothetical protein ACF9IK_00560 [Kitasatospora hibisci]|uniref:hypothetical protein n=1 Tax=Kitasatospora hibisci TaxID=3369522 RepID=UPI0037551E75